MVSIIGIASDHGGQQLKHLVVPFLRDMGHSVVDLGVASTNTSSVDYPDYAQALCKELLAGRLHAGILICGSGIGMSIAANRFHGIRAALVWSPESAKLAKEHNHANVLCLGARLLSESTALSCIEAWLNATPEPRHLRRIEKLELNCN